MWTMFYSDEMMFDNERRNLPLLASSAILNIATTEDIGNKFVLPYVAIVFRWSEVVRVLGGTLKKGDLLLFPCSMEKLLIPIDEPLSIVEVPFECNGEQINQSIGVEIESLNIQNQTYIK